MSPHPPSRRALPALLLVTGLVASAGAVAAAAGLPDLTTETSLRVLTPTDGARVGPNFLLSWSASRPGRHAVIVDEALPAPGALVRAGKQVITLDGTELRLTLGRRSGGSPSARDFHVVVVVPLDAQGRRVGEQTAVVHVRARA